MLSGDSLTLLQHAGTEHYGPFEVNKDGAERLFRTIVNNIDMEKTMFVNLLGCQVAKEFAKSLQDVLTANGFDKIRVQILGDDLKVHDASGRRILSINPKDGTFIYTFVDEEGNIRSQKSGTLQELEQLLTEDISE